METKNRRKEWKLKMNLGIKGKYALVTGGSYGIGRSIALALADEGCKMLLFVREIRSE